MKRTTTTLLFLTICLYVLTCTSCQQKPASEETTTTPTPPNIVFIYADDLGYGDLGCYGATDIKTPHLDALAANGIQFNEFYSISPVCSPSRAGLMTGRYPIRMGVHGVFFPESWTGLDTSEVLLPEKLQAAGYATGVVGKWHLGHHFRFLPLQNGFDEYFGIPYSNDMEAVVYMRGNEVVEEKVDQHYTTKTYTEEAIKFIEKHQKEPFFLYVPHNMPHVPIYASEAFEGKSGRGLYGDVIEELDWSVGQVMSKLRELGLEENTIVVFSSDNGPWITMIEHGGAAGPLRAGKQTTWEGGMRVPCLVQWKGKIQPGQRLDGMANMMDWFPTFLNLAGIPLPTDRPIDGEDISGVLLGTGKRQGNELAYFYNGKLEAYRMGDWKLHLPNKPYAARYTYPGEPEHGLLLFNLAQDIGEQQDLAATNPEKVAEIQARMDTFMKGLGDLPPGLLVKEKADNSHQIYLNEKYGSAEK